MILSAVAAIEGTESPIRSAFTYPALVAIAHRVRVLGFRIVKLNTALTGETLDQEDFGHHADTAIWDAFTKAGGNIDAPHEFPWGTSVTRRGVVMPVEEALTREALKLLRKELLGRSSVYRDTQLRLQPRKNRAMCDVYQWSTWQSAGDEGSTDGKGGSGRSVQALRLVTEYGAVCEQEEQLRQRELLKLVDELKAGLTTREFKWLVERAVHGKAQADQIRELQALDPKYQGEDGARRAETVINTTVSRAKARARKLLGEKWAELSSPDVV